MPTVFLSYARADASIVDRVSRDLRAHGIQTWLDRQDLMAGQAWLPQIEQAITKADYMLVFLSKTSLASKWVEQEYRAAFESQRQLGGTRIIPVLLEKGALPAFLAHIRYADFTSSYAKGMKRLLRAFQVAEGPKPKEIVEVSDLAKQVAGEVAKLLGLERTSLSQETSESTSQNVFVIIPLSGDMEPIFEGVREAAKSLGLTAQRVKDVPGDYKINDQIIRMIRSARFVVADLTHERPNVYFELGYARGLGKTVVTIAREGTTIHFDVKDWAYLPYIDSRILERDLRKRFEYELSRSIPGGPTPA